MEHFDECLDGQWHIEQDGNYVFDFTDPTRILRSHGPFGINSDTELMYTATNNLDRPVGFKEYEMTGNPHVAPMQPPAVHHHHTPTLHPVMQSPAATSNIDSPIDRQSSGTQTVFRGTQNAPRGSVQHPAHVWEFHKAEIQRLYMDQQKTLREVMTIMAQQGFCAR